VVIAGGDVRNVDSITEALTEGGTCDTIVHLASIRRETRTDTYEEVNEIGVNNVIMACKAAKVNRLITVGCLGAEVRSAYPFLRSIGKTEEIVRGSGLNFTVLKSAVVYGPDDWLTNWLMGITSSLPFVLPVPHSGQTKLQPLWVGDLAVCIERCLQVRSTFRQVVPVGGPQSLSLKEIAELTLKQSEKKRRLMRVPSAFTRQITRFLERFQGSLNELEMEALSYNRTTEIGGIHRVFGFAPAKMQTKLHYLSPRYEPPAPPVRFAFR
jgi:NADH dehydrogenase